MDLLVYYIELGLVVNFVAFFLDLLIAIYLISLLDIVQIRKLAITAESKREEFKYINMLGYLIPFYILYLIIIKIILIRKYYNETADSIEYIIEELNKFSIFKNKGDK